MSETRDFSLGAILSVTTGRFFANDIGLLYEILNYMTGDELFTHQLPRASGECAPHLLAQHPQLAEIVVPESFKDTPEILAWLATQEAEFGSQLPVKPLTAGDHTSIDPLTELSMMRPDLPVIVVAPGDGK